jgi:3-oxo-5-alpha-steroid 4-dehydrogenase
MASAWPTIPFCPLRSGSKVQVSLYSPRPTFPSLAGKRNGKASDVLPSSHSIFPPLNYYFRFSDRSIQLADCMPTLVEAVRVQSAASSAFLSPRALLPFIAAYPISIALPLLLFLLSSAAQNLAHAHLFSLPKYTLPQHWLFLRVVCPHYTCECLIYVSLALLARPLVHMEPSAPEPSFSFFSSSSPIPVIFNGTLLCNVVFVVVNLGRVAAEAKEWSTRKFGRENMTRKWRMIPYLW